MTMTGVIVPMTTPFTDDGAVDYGTLEKTTHYLIDHGIRCLYPCGTTGEMHLLTTQERKQIAETVINEAGGQAFVFVQCGGITFDETLELAQHAESIGANGIGIVSPSFFGLSDREMVDYYDRILKETNDELPVYLYNIPQCSGNDISVNACREIADSHLNVVGIKYSYNDANRVCDYLSIRDYDFSVLVGLERQFLGYLALGCDGVVSGCASIAPELFLELYSAFKSGDIASAQKYQRKIDKLFLLLTHDKSIARVKAAEQILGLGNGKLRSPLSSVTRETYLEIEDALSDILPGLKSEAS